MSHRLVDDRRFVSFWKTCLISLLGLLAAAALTAAPLPGGEDIDDLERTKEWVLELDGEELTGAEIYYSRYEVAYLVNAPRLGSLLISPRGQSVQRLARGALRKSGETRGRLEAGSVGGSASRFEVRGEDGSMHFQLGRHAVVFRPAPPMLGAQVAESLAERHPGFSERKAAYAPSKSAPRAAKAAGRELVLRTYLVSTSAACERIVPKIMAVEEAWRGAGVRFEYYGLPPRLVDDENARSNGISTVPTVAVMVDGEVRELLTGRQLDQPDEALERALAELTF